jgi:hypothetical protein
MFGRQNEDTLFFVWLESVLEQSRSVLHLVKECIDVCSILVFNLHMHLQLFIFNLMMYKI